MIWSSCRIQNDPYPIIIKFWPRNSVRVSETLSLRTYKQEIPTRHCFLLLLKNKLHHFFRLSTHFLTLWKKVLPCKIGATLRRLWQKHELNIQWGTKQGDSGESWPAIVSLHIVLRGQDLNEIYTWGSFMTISIGHLVKNEIGIRVCPNSTNTSSSRSGVEVRYCVTKSFLIFQFIVDSFLYALTLALYFWSFGLGGKWASIHMLEKLLLP